MATLQPGQPPPPDYYANNLSFVLEESSRRNADLLSDREANLVLNWRNAGASARRLFSRLRSRKGPWFRVDSLGYREVGCIETALDELVQRGLVIRCPEAPAQALLDLLTVAEIRRLWPMLRSRRKDALALECLSGRTDHALRVRIQSEFQWVAIADQKALARLELLFFGHDRSELATFILQDLGLRQFERYAIGPQTRPFPDLDSVRQFENLRYIARWLHERGDLPADRAAIARRLWPPVQARLVARQRNRLLNALGSLYERAGAFDEALEVYARSEAPPARERRIRLLSRLQDPEGASRLARRAALAPMSGDEDDFLRRWLAKGAGRSASTKRGRASIDIDIRETVIDGADARAALDRGIEAHACAEFAAAGQAAWHMENLFPLGLAGMLFWDIVFAPVEGAFSHPLQTGPRDLFWPDFAERRRALIDARLRALSERPVYDQALRHVGEAKRGIANRLVVWPAWCEARLGALLRVPDHRPILGLASYVLHHLERSRTGFPDLMVLTQSGSLGFCEVKSPNDQLQPAQRTWLRALTALGFSAHVRWYRT